MTLAELKTLAELTLNEEGRADAQHAIALARALLDVMPVVESSLDVRHEHAVVFDNPGLPPQCSTQRWVTACDVLRRALANTGGVS